ncbi:hypothetical protein JCM9957A_38280 [Kineosporia succinea]|uniref:DUF6318 domain-containing protein n=1 Tax=Kineosporia succinea TaxID=84632 RepID=A0ABT9P0N8_9ACTN|nr:hypothetical protein [Kineosporia succinea]
MTPPVRPADKRNAEGAEDFARYFWAVYNYSYEESDSALLGSLSEPACKFCASVGDELTQFAQTGARREGGQISVESMSVPPVEKPTRILVAAEIKQVAGTVIAKTGKETPVAEIRDAGAVMGLAWTDGAWMVHGVSIDAD